jgi:hypothetical protein
VGEAHDREEDDSGDDQHQPDGEHRAHAALGIPAGRDGNPRLDRMAAAEDDG